MKNSTYKKNNYYVGYRIYSKKEGHRRVRNMNKKLCKVCAEWRNFKKPIDKGFWIWYNVITIEQRKR